MFEAQVGQGAMWKKLIDSVKELVTEANLECSPAGMSVQAMDTSHVALVSLLLRGDGFKLFTCHHNVVLGLNMTSLSRILKSSENTDELTLRHDADSDLLTVISEAKSESSSTNKVSEFQLKLMEIEGESMGIPEQEFSAVVSMPSSEFAKMCRDMTIFGDSVNVEVSREGVKFRANGDIGEGYTMLRSSGPVPKRVEPAAKTDGKKGGVKSEKTTKKEEDVPIKHEHDENAVLTTLVEAPVKTEGGDRKKKDVVEVKSDAVFVTVEEPVSLTFALKYFTTFSKGAALSDRVEIHLAKDTPCMVEYPVEGLGFLRFYLAPKIDDAADA
jgi:proliferating cell nuclear antigen